MEKLTKVSEHTHTYKLGDDVKIILVSRGWGIYIKTKGCDIPTLVGSVNVELDDNNNPIMNESIANHITQLAIAHRLTFLSSLLIRLN